MNSRNNNFPTNASVFPYLGRYANDLEKLQLLSVSLRQRMMSVSRSCLAYLRRLVRGGDGLNPSVSTVSLYDALLQNHELIAFPRCPLHATPVDGQWHL